MVRIKLAVDPVVRETDQNHLTVVTATIDGELVSASVIDPADNEKPRQDVDSGCYD